MAKAVTQYMQKRTMSNTQSTPAKRLSEAVKSTGLSVREFARRADLPYPSLRDYIGGKRKPGFEALAAIASLSGVSVARLLLGAEPPERPDPILMGTIMAKLEEIDSVGGYSPSELRRYRAAEHGRIAALLYTRLAVVEDKAERRLELDRIVPEFLDDVRRLYKGGWDWEDLWRRELGDESLR